MNQEEYEKELKESMEDLKNVWKKCLNLFYNCDFDCNDYIVENYPFDSSFDEVSVEDWCDTVIGKIREPNIEQKNAKILKENLKEREEQEIENNIDLEV